MSAIRCVARNSAGGLCGFVGSEGAAPATQAVAGADISRSLDRARIVSVTQVGNDLHISLCDERVIVIQS